MTEAATIGMGGALRTGTSVEWWTPPEIFQALGLWFDLDPCAPPNPDAAWLPVCDRYSLPCDGLAEPWEGRVWLNPPYGAEARKWVERLVEHGDGIALVFTRTDARWAQAAMQAADAVCFIAGRVSFVEGAPRPDRKGHNPANGSMLLAYGADCADALAKSGLGACFAQPISDYKSGEADA